MTNDNMHSEDFFRELISTEGIEKAPKGFADRVMQSIEAAPAAVKARWWQQSGTWIASSVAFGFICLVVIVFTLDFSFMGSMFNGFAVDSSLIDRITREIGRELLGMTEGFTVSPITIVIVLALVALFILDRLIRRRPRIELRVM
ncbi:MAG TPA: hypothetical protein VK994_04215 [Bacteroidales bacterium]|nr:hypothetical protein [Bacteroidales bacterium]